MTPIPISIVVSDPWEVGEAVNWQPIPGDLLQTQNSKQGGKALVRFAHQVNYRGSAYRYAVASPRLEGSNITEVETGTTVGCALTGISEKQAGSSSPMDISKWRGGLAFIGDVTPEKLTAS